MALFDSQAMVWGGRGLSVLVALALFADGAKILFSRASTDGELAATGFSKSAATPLGITALVCAVVYALPQTAVLGAILITGFLGGSICTHFRLGKVASPPQIISLVLGVMAWGGLYLRDANLRALLPFVT